MNKIKKKKHPSLLETVRETAKGLYDANIINATTMKEFDELCLPKVKDLSPTQIKKIRLREKVSQPVFAIYINASPSTVKKWERGEKHPTGPALMLLNLIDQKGLKYLLV